MKNTCVYHLCVSCKKGLMFRGRQDYIRFINNMALLAYKYHIRILAFASVSSTTWRCWRINTTYAYSLSP